jgi:hypothetical protein
MNERIQKLIKRRFWIGFAIALVSGVYIGKTFHYQGLFVNDWDLYPLLIIPSVAAGVFSGWKSILNCALLHFIVAAMFAGRALIGRQLTADYLQFAIHLTAGSVLGILPRALLWGYLASLPVSMIIVFSKKLTGPNKITTTNGHPR